MSMDFPAQRILRLDAVRPAGARRLKAGMRLKSPWVVAGLASVVLHLLLGGWAVSGLRLGRSPLMPDTLGTVELLMVEQKGSGETQEASPASPRERAERQAEAPPAPLAAEEDPAPSGRPVVTSAEPGEAVPVPAPAPAPAAVAAEAAAPVPPRESEQPAQAQEPVPPAPKQAALS